MTKIKEKMREYQGNENIKKRFEKGKKQRKGKTKIKVRNGKKCKKLK